MDTVLLVGIGACAVMMILIIVLFILLISMKKKYNRFMKGLGDADVEKLMHQYADELQSLRTHVQTRTESRIAAVEAKLPKVLRNVGMVSYNAFEHMGNQMSFSVAAMDDGKDGFVLTGIYSRDSSYIYAKEIKAGIPNKELSAEEKEAMRIAQENGRS